MLTLFTNEYFSIKNPFVKVECLSHGICSQTQCLVGQLYCNSFFDIFFKDEILVFGICCKNDCNIAIYCQKKGANKRLVHSFQCVLMCLSNVNNTPVFCSFVNTT
jgi:hypothetical protein